MNNETLLQKVSLALSYVVQNQDGFSDDQALQVAELYPEWHTGVNYRAGQIVRYGGELYRCISDHASQADWTPTAVPSLWDGISFTGDVENWEQPTGAHDAYNVGDHVMHNGAEWVSLVNGNVWEPSEANANLWEAI